MYLNLFLSSDFSKDLLISTKSLPLDGPLAARVLSQVQFMGGDCKAERDHSGEAAITYRTELQEMIRAVSVVHFLREALDSFATNSAA